MYATLFIHGNMVGGKQNLAAAVAVHVLENLLEANVARGEKLVALILSFPESQRDGGGPECPGPAVPTTWHVGVRCLLVLLDAARSAPCTAPAIMPRHVSASQTWFCAELNSILGKRQLFKI